MSGSLLRHDRFLHMSMDDCSGFVRLRFEVGKMLGVSFLFSSCINRSYIHLHHGDFANLDVQWIFWVAQ